MDALRPILVVGTDPILLKTRRMLLEGCGFCVWEACSVEAAEHLLRTKRVLLLVLCHTLSAKGRRRVEAAARETIPDMLILVLVAAYNVAVEEDDVIIHPIEGPRGFLKAIQTLLH